MREEKGWGGKGRGAHGGEGVQPGACLREVNAFPSMQEAMQEEGGEEGREAPEEVGRERGKGGWQGGIERPG